MHVWVRLDETICRVIIYMHMYVYNYHYYYY